jgi:hypothetical protein
MTKWLRLIERWALTALNVMVIAGLPLAAIELLTDNL